MAFDVTLMQNYGLPAELASQVQALSGTNFADNFGDTFSRLSIKGFQFSIVSDASSTPLGDKPLTVVFLGDDPKGNYLTYYSGAYSATAEDTKPTAVWYASDPAPAVVPPTVMQKDPRTGKYGYSRKQRTVIALADETGVVTPIVFDINAVSMFGDNCNLGNFTALSYSNYRRALSKLGILPCCIATQLILDRTQGIPAVKFIPVMNGNGQPQLLPPDLLKKVIETASSKEVAELLKVHTLPDPVASAPAPTPAYAQSAPSYASAEPAYAQSSSAYTQSAPEPAYAQPAPAYVQPANVNNTFADPVPNTAPEPTVLADADALLQSAHAQVAEAAKVTGSPLTELVSGAQAATTAPAEPAPATPVMTTSADLASLLTAAAK